MRAIAAHAKYSGTTDGGGSANLSGIMPKEYSFEATEPYFLLTEFGMDVRQMLGYQWDVVGRAGTSRLAYQRMAVDGATAESGRTDWVDFYGGGVGRRLGENVRIGFDVDRVARRSTLAFREYQGFRIGGSFTYGY